MKRVPLFLTLLSSASVRAGQVCTSVYLQSTKPSGLLAMNSKAIQGLWVAALRGPRPASVVGPSRIWAACAGTVVTVVIAAIGMQFPRLTRQSWPDFGGLHLAHVLLVVPVVQWILIWVVAVFVAVIWFWPRRGTAEMPTS